MGKRKAQSPSFSVTKRDRLGFSVGIRFRQCVGLSDCDRNRNGNALSELFRKEFVEPVGKIR